MKGTKYKSEKKKYIDSATGTTVWQMTDAPCNHHNMYMTKSCFTADSKTTVFLSTRSGNWNLYKMEIESGEIVQLTDFTHDVDIYSVGILPDDRVYGIMGNRMFVLDINTFEEETLYENDHFSVIV